MTHDPEELLGRKPCILIVDDDEDLLLVMRLKLQSEGYQVMTSYNGDQLFEQLEHSHPDTILLDITMNGISGETICKQIKENNHTHSIPILMFSANRNIEEITKSCGADGYISKPFEISQLKEKISDVLQKKN